MRAELERGKPPLGDIPGDVPGTESGNRLRELRLISPTSLAFPWLPGESRTARLLLKPDGGRETRARGAVALLPPQTTFERKPP